MIFNNPVSNSTPIRNFNPQILIRKNAAEELKKEQEEKARERRRVIDERCGKPRHVDGLARGEYLNFCKKKTFD